MKHSSFVELQALLCIFILQCERLGEFFYKKITAVINSNANAPSRESHVERVRSCIFVQQGSDFDNMSRHLTAEEGYAEVKHQSKDQLRHHHIDLLVEVGSLRSIPDSF